MTYSRQHRQWQRLANWDYSFTRWINRSLTFRGVSRGFALISWLGNGKFWYAVMILLPTLHGAAGLRVTCLMAAVGIGNTAVYLCIKSLTRRPRPCHAHEDILRGAVPLDEYSFPSGHTMHAVGFTAVATQSFPEIAVLLWAFTALVAMSRLVLGLHYPSDVGLGAAIGWLLAWLSLTFE